VIERAKLVAGGDSNSRPKDYEFPQSRCQTKVAARLTLKELAFAHLTKSPANNCNSAPQTHPIARRDIHPRFEVFFLPQFGFCG
jgi:hypothetical protein